MTDEIIKGKIARLRKEFAHTEGYDGDKESKMYYVKGVNSMQMLDDILELFHEIIGDSTSRAEVYDPIAATDVTP